MGVTDHFVDYTGQPCVADVDTLQALITALNGCKPSQAVNSSDSSNIIVGQAGTRTVVAPWPSSRGVNVMLRLEDDSGEQPVRIDVINDQSYMQFEDPLPLGVHKLKVARRGSVHEYFLLCPPRSLHHVVRAQGRQLGVFLPLYSVRSERNFGVGTLTELGELIKWSRSCGASLVGTLPLFPTFLESPFEPSPYAPITRLHWNELFIDPHTSPEWAHASVQRTVGSARFREQLRNARNGEWVDYQKTWRLLARVLKVMAQTAYSSPQRWNEILRATHSGHRNTPSNTSSSDVEIYATFRARVDQAGDSWRSWSTDRQTGRLDTDAFQASRMRMYIYAQALANQQMAHISQYGDGRRPLYLDLPVGVHPDGFDVWQHPELFLSGISAGAPPDQLFSGGQVWGFPPLHPTAGRADGYAYLRAILRRMLSVAGVLRIDHVMGLFRMYCVPHGFDGQHGAYLLYPADELFAIVMIEAARANAIVVGEDLGTVPPIVRRMMRARGILGMHVQQFALGSSSDPITLPDKNTFQLASLNTHDTPTFAGFWHGDDIRFRKNIGLISRDGARVEQQGRKDVRRAVTAACKRTLTPTRSAMAIGTELMGMQAATSAPITLVNLEDVWGERRAQNVPGLTDEYPNWRRRARMSLPDITDSHRLRNILRRLASVRTRKVNSQETTRHGARNARTTQ